MESVNKGKKDHDKKGIFRTGVLMGMIKNGGLKNMKNYTTEAVEACPYCESENTYPGWNKEMGYIGTCRECGSKMFLCDECLHAEDNPYQKCNWHREIRDGKEYSCCFRGEYEVKNGFFYVTIYADNTGWYTEEELDAHGNMVEIKVPEDFCLKWYEENKVNECSFLEWFYEISDCDMTDNLFGWLIDHGFEPKKEEARMTWL